MRNRSSIISMDVNITNIRKTLHDVEILASRKSGSYICVSNAHMCMEVYDSADFQYIVNHADVVIPDGKVISWAQKLLGYKEASQVRGEDIMNLICGQSGVKHLNIGLYGGSSDEMLAVVKQTLLHCYPDINITYAYSPPFHSLTLAEDVTAVADINRANVDILFVGIGCPKQEYWMAQHKDKLSCVMLGVGAAYDFIAGSKRHAPRWVQQIGMEWLFRLCCEPNRLWKRYLSTNPRFIWQFGKQLYKQKLHITK